MRSLKIILFAILLVSCEEYFNPDTDATEPIYVFEGLVTDQPGPYKVKVSKSYGYNGKIETVTDADVQIKCSNKPLYILKCDSTGCYVSDSAAFLGKVGISYKLIVNTSDGKHFESPFEEMLPCPDIDEVGGIFYEEKTLTYNGNEYFDEVETGICATNKTNALGFTPYYRYECKIILQTQQHYNATGFTADRFIYHPLLSTGHLFIADANSYINNQIIDNHIYKTANRTFFVGIDSLVEGVEEYEIINRGEFVRVKQLSMDEKQYKFWKAVKDQQENTNYLFGQVENRPVGNISGKNGEKALGYFCVSSVKQNFCALSLNESKKIVKRYDIDYFPDTDTVAIYSRWQRFTKAFEN